jgi:phytoene desaturase
MQKKAIITGTGLGGLTAALMLSSRGYEVEMVEQAATAGGRLNQLKKDGFTFDLAPTFFSMTYEFRDFVKFCGMEMPFRFQELDPVYSVYFRNRSRPYTIYKDLDKLAAEFAAVEPGFRQAMDKYLKSAGKLFHDTENLVIKKNFNSLFHFLITLTRVPPGHAPKMFRTLWGELGRYFSSQEVKEIFSLIAFFLGATPFDTPAIYSLLNYTELVHDGYHNVEGGMYKIVEGLLEECRKRNIRIHYNTRITGYTDHGSKLDALTDSQGRSWKADVFVINADAAVFRGRVFGRKKFSDARLDRMKWSLAPFTMYLGVKGKLDGLNHHNYFLGDNFRDYAGKIFRNKISLDRPYYYVCVSSGFNPACAPEGCENVFILCPVPDLRFRTSWDDRETVADAIIADLSARSGHDLKNRIISRTILSPDHWEIMFGLHRGSGLGLAHDLNQIGGFRPKNYDEVFGNVFYTGSSTVPGTGLPMAVISSRLAVERILRRHGPLS